MDRFCLKLSSRAPAWVAKACRLAGLVAAGLSAVAGHGATNKTLLLDATRIASADNVRIAVGVATKSGANPLFAEDQAWEPRYDNMYPNVVWDAAAQKYRCWYNPFLVEVEDWAGSNPVRMRWLYRQSGLCYAESGDGIHWEKPAMDRWPFHGKPSNILLRDVHGVGVIRDDHTTDPARRYKTVYVNEVHGRRTTVAVQFSPDGFEWGDATVLDNFKIWADTHNNAFWAPTLGRYVLITRDWNFDNPGPVQRVRLVARSESSDFIHWSTPRVVLQGLDDNLQIYSMPVIFYAGLYIGFPSIFNIAEDRLHVELTWSADTVHWHRVDPGAPLIPNGAPGEFDWGCVFAAVPLVGADGTIRLYYAGSDGPHYGERRGGLGLATLRPDGFAAAVAEEETRPATIITTPTQLRSAGDLRVTADIGAAGGLEVILLDAEGRELARSQSMRGGFTDEPVEWAQPPPDQLPDGVRIKFVFHGTRLYAYSTGATQDATKP